MMEKKITEDHHHDQASISSSVVSGDSSRPSLKIRIRITPEMRKQLMKWDKQQQQQQAVKQINVKSEKEEEEAVKEINVKSEKEEEEEVVKEINVKSEVKVEEEEEVVIPAEVLVKESIEVHHHHHQAKQELLLVDCSSSFELKLEATKRKFHDSYQQIANAKRQRRIQVIDPWNLPQPAQGKVTSSKLVAGGAKSRILNVIVSKKKTNNNLFSASRSTLLKPSYIC